MKREENKRKSCHMAGLSFGGLEEIRTPDPHNANVVRSQLRYKPIACGLSRRSYYSFLMPVCQAKISA